MSYASAYPVAYEPPPSYSKDHPDDVPRRSWNENDGEDYNRPPGSYYVGSEYPDHVGPINFRSWTSPPGIIRILLAIVMLICAAVFACVASTLQWDYNYSNMGGGYGGIGGGYGGMGGSYGGMGGGYGGMGGGGYNSYGTLPDPSGAKGFMIAMAIICFIVGIILFIMCTLKSQRTRTRSFYLVVMIVSGILAGFFLIATIVYIVGVNPLASSSGSVNYVQIQSLCNQFYAPTISGGYWNQYLYHYCVVDPQEAIAIVCGFLIVVGLLLIMLFAWKTRNKMSKYGEDNIMWERDVEDWVNNIEPNTTETYVAPETDVASKYTASLNALRCFGDRGTDTPPVSQPLPMIVNDLPVKNSYEEVQKLPPRHRPRRKRSPRNDSHGPNDSDYTTDADSCDELDDDEDLESAFPPIRTDAQRLSYKREFENIMVEYKKMQADLDNVTRRLADLDKQLDTLPEDSADYQAVAEEYNELKDAKRKRHFQDKKQNAKELKRKASHIKQMVNDYDRA
uniref:Occludin n=2 Tax=Eptatretus burgeri TaxID=7764 RepID=A0A8C4NLK3_EPTBU